MIAHLSKKWWFFIYVQDIHPDVRRCIFPDFSIKCTGDTVGVVIGMRTTQLCSHTHLLRSRCANNTPARVINEAAGSLKPPAELQTHAAHVQSHNKRKDLPEL